VASADTCESLANMSLQWEQADPPWQLPNYVGDFTQALKGDPVLDRNWGVAAPVDCSASRTRSTAPNAASRPSAW